MEGIFSGINEIPSIIKEYSFILTFSLTVCLLIYLFIYLSVWQEHLFVGWSVSLLVNQSVGWSVCRLVGRSVDQSVGGWSVCRSVGQFIGQSFCLCFLTVYQPECRLYVHVYKAIF